MSYEERYYVGGESGDVGVEIVSSGPNSNWDQIKYGYIKMILTA